MNNRTQERLLTELVASHAEQRAALKAHPTHAELALLRKQLEDMQATLTRVTTFVEKHYAKIDTDISAAARSVYGDECADRLARRTSS